MDEDITIDINQLNLFGQSCFHIACITSCQTGDLSLIHILLKAGIDINSIDYDGTNVLDIAIKNSNWCLLALLLSQPSLSVVPNDSLMPSFINFGSFDMSSYPDKLSCLAPNLQELVLSKNRIVSLPNSLSLLTSLKRIRLKDMNLRSFPTCLLSIYSLEYIDLTKNLISHIPPQIENLQSLSTLKLRDNALNSLPHSLSKLPKLKKITIEKNPLESIPKEVLARGTPTLLNYLKQMDGKTNNWKRIKLLVLGEEATGKTSLLSCFHLKNKTKKGFQKRNRKTISTDGLEINNWQADNDIEFQTWDFAGQQVFYPTHQFFLSSRCIYIITFNASNINAARPKYWVRQISAIAKDRPPIFLVGTHIDDESCTDTVQLQAKARLQTLFNFRKYNIIDCLFISSKTGEGIKELVQSLINIGREHHMLKQMVPSNYLVLDKLLTQERSKHQWVRWSIYLKWALQCDVEKSNLPVTTQFLHDVGSLIYFDNPALRDIVILDPQWLANIFASLITFNHQWIKDGILKTSDLPQIWKQYPKQLYSKLMMLLKKFGVASSLHQEKSLSDSKLADTYLIPSLLPESKPDIISKLWPPQTEDDTMEFGRLYTFDFSFEFSKILVTLLHADNLENISFWKNGILIKELNFYEISKQRALIQWLPNSSQLKVSVRVSKEYFSKLQKLQLLRQLLEVIDTILEGFYCGSPSVIREVECSHCLSRRSCLLEGIYKYKLDDLVESISDGRWIVYCRNVPTRPVDIRYLAPDISFCDFPVISQDKYEIKKEVGRGGFGIVYLANISGYDAAVKELLFNGNDNNTIDTIDDDGESGAYKKFSEFQQEVYVMSALNHINLVRLFGVSINPLRMIMEWCGKGDLWHLLHPKDKTLKIELSWKLRYRIALDIAKGMNYLQNVTPPIVHRDLRSPNIFLVSIDENSNVCAKVADFGLSRHVENYLGETLPTWRWLAPEVIDFESQKYDERSDIYSFAIVLYEIATGKVPYDYGDEIPALDIKRGIISGKLRPSIPDNIHPKYARIMRHCWRNEPHDRMSFTKVISILSELLEIPVENEYCPSDAVSEELEQIITLPQVSSKVNFNENENETRELIKLPSLITKKIDLRPKPISCITVIDSKVWCGFADGYVTVFDSKTQSIVAAFIAFEDSKIQCMLHVDDIIWIGSTTIKIYDTKKFTKKKSISTKDIILSMKTISLGNSSYVWVGDLQGFISIFNTSVSYYNLIF